MGVNKKLKEVLKYFKVMKEAMQKKTDEEAVKYFISVLVQKRDQLFQQNLVKERKIIIFA